MENVTNKKATNSLWKAFLFSGLVMLGGAIVWGIVYYIGVFSAWVAAGSAILACMVFLKHYDKIDWKVWLWVIALTVIFNLLALFGTICVALVGELDCTFGDAVSLLIQSLQNGTEVVTALVSDAISTVLFSVIGTVLGITIEKKKKKDAQIAEMNASCQNMAKDDLGDGNDVSGAEAVNVNHLVILEEIEKEVKIYMETHNKDAFNASIDALTQKYRQELTAEQIELLKQRAKLLRSQDNSSNPERAVACDIIEKI